MKRILALLLAIIMIFTLAACGNNIADDTDGGATANTESSTTSAEETTESTEETTETTSSTDGTEESTSATEGTQAPTEGTESTEKPTEQTKPTEPPKPTEPSHKHSYSGEVTTPATCTEKGTKTFTCSCGSCYTESISATGHSFGEWETTKEPTTTEEGNSQRKCSSCGATENKSIAKLPVAQSYCVGLELVSIEHKTTKYDIDGMNFFDKLYGKNKGGQIGDVFTYEIMTSNGEPIDIRIEDVQNCTYEINGNTIKITLSKIRVWEKWASLSFYAKDESGNEKVFSTGDISMYMYDGDMTQNCAVMDGVIEVYAERLGMRRLWGQDAIDAGCTNSDNYDDYDNIRIPNNENWIREVIEVVDKYHQKGSTAISFITNGLEGWQGISNKGKAT